MLQDDVYLLSRLGNSLDYRPASLTRSDQLVVPVTVRDWLIAHTLKVRDRNGNIRLLQLNRAQLEYSHRCTLKNIVLKARQLGMTTYIAARFFIETITQPGSLTVQVAHDQESAEQIFRIVHRFWENLPAAAQEGALITSRANIRQIVFPRLDSEYRVATAADENAGRGLTIQHLHCSEVARWPGGGVEALTSLRAAVPALGEIVLESTPRGAGGVFYEEWQRAAEIGYTRHFFPWWLEESYQGTSDAPEVDTFTPDEQRLVDLHGLTASQISFRRNIASGLRGLAIQEYAEDPESCFLASGDCVFDLDAIKRALESRHEPFEVHDNGCLSIWLPVRPGKQYIVGVDPAGGGREGDYSCAEVIETESGMQCAELHGHFPPLEFAKRLGDLGRLYNAALLAVERNNHGYGVLAHLRRDNYPNIYQDHNKDGWLTNAVSRPAMIENLAATLVSVPDLFQSKRLLGEMRTFVRNVDGTSAATGGAHDDCVMAVAIALAVRQRPPRKDLHDADLNLVSLPVLP